MRLPFKSAFAATICGLVVAAPATQSMAASLPDVVRVIVPFSTGSGVDVLARTLAEQIQKATGSSIVVENVNGAGGTIGASQVAKADKDGRVLLFTANPPFITGPVLQKNNAYNAIDDFTPIAQVAVTPMVLVAGKKAPFSDFEGFVDYAGKNPGKVDYASTGVGTPSHLSVEVIAKNRGLDLQAIHYKAAGQALTDTIGGQVPMYMPSFPAAMAQIESGNLTALAIGSAERLPAAPNTPTVAELLNQPGLTLGVWYGFLAPAGVSAELVEHVADVVQKAMQTEKVSATMQSAGITPEYVGPAEFRKQIAVEEKEGNQLLEDLGII